MKLLRCIKLAYTLYKEPNSSLTKFADTQLKRAGFFDSDVYYGNLGVHASEIILLFASQGHSRVSAKILSRTLSRLLDFKPIVPISDTPESWNRVSDNLYQHKELSSVFKFDDYSYDMDKYSISDSLGEYTNSVSMHAGKITFPYLPAERIVVKKHSLKYLSMYLGYKWHHFWMAKGY